MGREIEIWVGEEDITQYTQKRKLKNKVTVITKHNNLQLLAYQCNLQSCHEIVFGKVCQKNDNLHVIACNVSPFPLLSFLYFTCYWDSICRLFALLVLYNTVLLRYENGIFIFMSSALRHQCKNKPILWFLNVQ